jgi:hypothetical protein
VVMWPDVPVFSQEAPAEWTRVERCWAAVHDERADDTSVGRHIYAGVGVQHAGGDLSSTASVRIESKPALMASLEATFTARGTHIFPSNCKIPQPQLSGAVADVRSLSARWSASYRASRYRCI